MAIRPRIFLARFLLILAGFINSITIMVMRPDDLIEFGRQNYDKHHHKKAYWARPDILNIGLNSVELPLLEKLPLKSGNLLLLGVGGGREAIPLIKLGFKVTGVDFVQEALDQTQQYAKQNGLEIDCIIQDYTRLELPECTYDVTWMANHMYSSVPTRQRRIEMLRRIYQMLIPGGFFFCWFALQPKNSDFPLYFQKSKKAVAWLTLGNISYEPGDILYGSHEFLHIFLSEAEVISEFVEIGLEVVHLINFEKSEDSGFIQSGVMLKKPVS